MEPIGDPSLDSDEYEEELDGYEGEAETGAGRHEDVDEPGPDDDEDEEL